MSATLPFFVDGKYRVDSVLGTGGFGTVYKAWQIDLERMVALKILRDFASRDSETLVRFEREARALNILRHKNIVAFYAFGALADSYYIAMELVNGIALDRLISEHQITPVQSVKIAIQLLDALSAAHEAGVLHRDLKPSNVLVVEKSSETLIKVIDFGLAKLMPGCGLKSQTLTEAGFALGSFMYMSPEQCTGGEVGSQTDIYSVGCILFEMLTGNPPFDANEGIAIMLSHLNADPPSLENFYENCECAKKLDAILQRALAKATAARWGSAQEFRDALMELSEMKLNALKLRTSSKVVKSSFSAQSTSKKSAQNGAFPNPVDRK